MDLNNIALTARHKQIQPRAQIYTRRQRTPTFATLLNAAPVATTPLLEVPHEPTKMRGETETTSSYLEDMPKDEPDRSEAVSYDEPDRPSDAHQAKPDHAKTGGEEQPSHTEASQEDRGQKESDEATTGGKESLSDVKDADGDRKAASRKGRVAAAEKTTSVATAQGTAATINVADTDTPTDAITSQAAPTPKDTTLTGRTSDEPSDGTAIAQLIDARGKGVRVPNADTQSATTQEQRYAAGESNTNPAPPYVKMLTAPAMNHAAIQPSPQTHARVAHKRPAHRRRDSTGGRQVVNTSANHQPIELVSTRNPQLLSHVTSTPPSFQQTVSATLHNAAAVHDVRLLITHRNEVNGVPRDGLSPSRIDSITNTPARHSGTEGHAFNVDRGVAHADRGMHAGRSKAFVANHNRDGRSHLKPVEQVAVSIRQRTANGDSIRIQLHPRNLGKVDVKLAIKDDMVNATIITETREAFDIMRADGRVLERALNASGLKTGTDGLNFQMRSDQDTGTTHSNDGGGRQDQGQHHGHASGSPDEEVLAVTNLEAMRRTRADARGGIDVCI